MILNDRAVYGPNFYDPARFIIAVIGPRPSCPVNVKARPGPFHQEQCSFSFDFPVSVSFLIFRIFQFLFQFQFHNFSVLVFLSVKLRVIFKLFYYFSFSFSFSFTVQCTQWMTLLNHWALLYTLCTVYFLVDLIIFLYKTRMCHEIPLCNHAT